LEKYFSSTPLHPALPSLEQLAEASFNAAEAMNKVWLEAGKPFDGAIFESFLHINHLAFTLVCIALVDELLEIDTKKDLTFLGHKILDTVYLALNYMEPLVDKTQTQEFVSMRESLDISKALLSELVKENENPNLPFLN